jgi:hypothetical protein
VESCPQVHSRFTKKSLKSASWTLGVECKF